MNQTTKQLIEQGSLGKRNRNNMIYGLTGGIILLMGVLCFIIKALIPVTVDANGILHEPFFLLPVGYLLIFIGCLVVGASLIRQFKK